MRLYLYIVTLTTLLIVSGTSYAGSQSAFRSFLGLSSDEGAIGNLSSWEKDIPGFYKNGALHKDQVVQVNNYWFYDLKDKKGNAVTYLKMKITELDQNSNPIGGPKYIFLPKESAKDLIEETQRVQDPDYPDVKRTTQIHIKKPLLIHVSSSSNKEEEPGTEFPFKVEKKRPAAPTRRTRQADPSSSAANNPYSPPRTEARKVNYDLSNPDFKHIKSEKPIPYRACGRIMNEDGNYGDVGRKLAKEMRKAPDVYLNDNFLTPLCPNFKNLDDEEKIRANVYFWMTLATTESTCDPNARHVSTTEGWGYWASEVSHSLRNKRDTQECHSRTDNEIKTDDKQVECTVGIMRDLYREQERPSVLLEGNKIRQYWGPLEYYSCTPAHAYKYITEIVPNMSAYGPCTDYGRLSIKKPSYRRMCTLDEIPRPRPKKHKHKPRRRNGGQQ